MSSRITRREFLEKAGKAAVYGGACLAGPGFSPRPAVSARFPDQPNFLIISTDQERQPRHWPTGWAESNLTSRGRLTGNGLEFTRAFCAAAMCSPSRASLLTGLHPAHHGVTLTLTYDGSISDRETPLSPRVQNIAHMLKTAGYDVQLRGKWHLSKNPAGGEPDAVDVAAFGFDGWIPTTAGEAATADNFGGGCAAHDRDIADQAIEYLNGVSAGDGRPFCLMVSLANPHDVLAYPSLWDQEDCGAAAYQNSADLDQGISVPDSCDRDDLSQKPSVQEQSRQLYALGLGALNTPLMRRQYVNFYAYLHKQADAQIDRILDVLEQRGLTESTVIVRTSDHGEMGLAHGGLRQKMFNLYEESINVPLIISNPLLFPQGFTSRAYVSLLDVMPTLANLGRVPDQGQYNFQGRDLTPFFSGASVEGREALLYTFDDVNAGQGDPIPLVTPPNRIRGILVRDDDGEWKYARYFDADGREADQLEMYRLKDGAGGEADPDELDNLAQVDSPNYALWTAKRNELAALLARMEKDRLRPGGDPGQAARMLLLE